MKVRRFFGVVTILLLILFQSCTKVVPPTLITYQVVDITQTTATISGSIQTDGGSAIKDRGFCIDTIPNPTIERNAIKTFDGNGLGAFSRKVTLLKPNKTYFVRAFAYNDEVIVYGNEIQFTTLNNLFIDARDGRSYKMVNIGTQIWMAENLKATKLNDGSPIPNVTDGDDWGEQTSPGYCIIFNDTEEIPVIYGHLYNFHAVNSGKLCPIGWHIPTTDEWNILFNYLSGIDIAGAKLKEVGIEYWASPNIGATNEVGFSALGGGFRYESGFYYGFGDYATFWTANESAPNRPFAVWISNMGLNAMLHSQANDYNRAFSVRCIQD